MQRCYSQLLYSKINTSNTRKHVQKTSKKNICEIMHFSRSQLSFRARKKRSVGSWCPTYIFLLPKRYINNLQQELGQKLLKPWRKIIFYAKKELFLSFPADPTLKYNIYIYAHTYIVNRSLRELSNALKIFANTGQEPKLQCIYYII